MLMCKQQHIKIMAGRGGAHFNYDIILGQSNIMCNKIMHHYFIGFKPNSYSCHECSGVKSISASQM